MATAGKITVAEVEEILKVGELDPDQIHTPGIYINRIIKGENYSKAIENLTVRENELDREQMCFRAASRIKEGDYVNLGIGMPTLVANYIEEDLNITLQSENGMLGMGPFPIKRGRGP